jgi:ABC-2 type transport system permease protein
MHATRSLSLVELKLFLREPLALFFVFALPIALLLIFSAIPAMTEPDPAMGGATAVQGFIAPMAVSLVIAISGLTILPVTLSTYRERGVLRRLAATPASPSSLLVAQTGVSVAMVVVAVAVLLGVGAVALGLPMPDHPLGFLASFALGVGSLFAVGLVIAAVAPGARAATAIGNLLFVPSMFLGGVYFPREGLPDVIARIGEFTPLGAALQALRDSWTGGGPQTLHLVVMAVTLVVLGAVAARTFRWR